LLIERILLSQQISGQDQSRQMFFAQHDFENNVGRCF